MSSYTPKQHTLSESCKQLLELWGRLDMVKEEDVTRFWDSFKEFYKYANKLKVAYKIDPLVDNLTHLQSDVDDAWQKKQQYLHSGLNERGMEENKRILLLYEIIINYIRKISDKSHEMETQKTCKFSRIGKALKQLSKDKKPPFEPSYDDPEYVRERLAKFINFLESERNNSINYERWLVYGTIILSALISVVNVFSINITPIPWWVPIFSALFGGAVSIFTGILQFEKYHQTWLHKKIVATQLRQQYHRWKHGVGEYGGNSENTQDCKNIGYNLDLLVHNCEDIILRDAIDYANLFTDRINQEQSTTQGKSTDSTKPGQLQK
jgi:uncharacterized protein DUF4231